MDEQTRKALELAREALKDCDPMTIAGSEARALAAIDAVLSAPSAPVARVPGPPFAVFDEFGKGADDRMQDYAARLVDEARAIHAAPVAQGYPAYFVTVSGRLHLTDPTAVAFDLPDGRHALYTTPQPAPAPLPVSEPSDADIDAATAAARDALMDHVNEYGTIAEGQQKYIRQIARAVIALRPVAPRAPLTDELESALEILVEKCNYGASSSNWDEVIHAEAVLERLRRLRTNGIGQEGGAA